MLNCKIFCVMVKCLFVYYWYLNVLLNVNKYWVLLMEFFEVVQVDFVMIWWDFFYFGEFGKWGYGYDVEKLLNFFKGILK